MSNSLSFMRGATRVESARSCDACTAGGLGRAHGLELQE